MRFAQQQIDVQDERKLKAAGEGLASHKK